MKSEADLLRDKFPYGHIDFIPMCLEEMELHSQKNHDYARGGDALGNFHRVSAILKVWGFDISPTLVALIYMLKQLDAVGNMLGHNYEGDIEGVDPRLQDVHVYAKLMRILHKE